jgi:hypothetical protein
MSNATRPQRLTSREEIADDLEVRADAHASLVWRTLDQRMLVPGGLLQLPFVWPLSPNEIALER